MERELYRVVTGGDVDGLANLIGHRRSERPVSAELTTPIQLEPYNHNPPLNILNQFTPGGNTSLHLASFLGHLQIVQNLLQHITEAQGSERSHHFILLQNLKGDTALHEAAMGGHYQILDILLRESNEMVNMTNNAGESALFKAAEGGHGEIVSRLLSLISPDYDMRRTSDGQTPLHAAVLGAHKDVIESLLEQRPDLLTQADHFGRTPLHIVAFSKNASRIAKLLLKRSDPNSLCYVVDGNHQSALHLAVIEGKTGLVKEILTHAPDCLEIVDQDGRNALHLVAVNAVQIFEKASRRIKTLVLQLSVSKQVINGLDNHGKTPLDIVLEKMSNDERLYSGMKTFLQMKGARSTPKIVQYEEASGMSSATNKWREQNQIIAVSAILIATVAFLAAITLPEKYTETETFVFFVVCDVFAFCGAVAATLVLLYAVYGKQEEPFLVKTSLLGLWIASFALVGAFASISYHFIYSDHPWLARFLIWMTFAVHQVIFLIIIYRSKSFVFTDEGTYMAVSVILVDYFMDLFDIELMAAIWTTLLLGWLLFQVWKDIGVRGRTVAIVACLGVLAYKWKPFIV